MLAANENKAQTLAIEHASGPLQVLAGPGSGKTYLTIRRIRHLIRHHGISPDHILVITFTKAAAMEMKERFSALTQQAYPEVRFGTFHAIYYHILKQSGYSGLRIITLKEKRNYINHILREIKSGEAENAELCNELIKSIAHIKINGGCSEDMESVSFFYDFEEKIKEQFPFIYNEYCRMMREENKIDFDDMILLCDKLLEERPEILSFWQNTFTHILVDEFQDISPMQYRILCRLALPQNNLFVVGDDDQSIYGFRGAGPGIMKQFMEDYAQASQLTLTINYRSGPHIVEAAGMVINDNKERFLKELKANKAEGGTVSIISFSTREEELAYLSGQLRGKTIEELTQSAIIYRTNAEVGALSRTLASLRIPFHMKERGTHLFQHAVAKDMIAVLSFARDVFIGGKKSGNRSDFLRFMNKPSRYISRQAIPDPLITEQLLLDYYKGLGSSSHSNMGMQETVKQLWRDLKRISSLRPYLAIDYICKNMDYKKYICEGKDKEERKEMEEILQELQKEAIKYRSFSAWKEAIDEYVSLMERAGKEPEQREGVQLLTMHVSKGLEYNNVYLLDIGEGKMPGKRAIKPEEIEEERRLLYVAMTRAKEHLEILYCNEPSAFIVKLKKTLDGK